MQFSTILFILSSFVVANDHKTSAINPGFAPFDNLKTGPNPDTVACKVDEDCQSACCDGKKCRAPDALKPGVESCRNGLTPNFNGGLHFVQIGSGQAAAAGNNAAAAKKGGAKAKGKKNAKKAKKGKKGKKEKKAKGKKAAKKA
ncbi:hypothetical protein HDV06_001966 [Boothiomyces sp. JEL0866]|nr:hypothetical protein HDV06_001966 [Boothiomyces sp. JEL0866]